MLSHYSRILFFLVVTLIGCAKNQSYVEEVSHFELDQVNSDNFKEIFNGLKPTSFESYFVKDENYAFDLGKPSKKVNNLLLNEFFGCQKKVNKLNSFYPNTDYSSYIMANDPSSSLEWYSFYDKQAAYIIVPLVFYDETDQEIVLFSFNTNGKIIDCLTIFYNSVSTHVLESTLKEKSIIEIKHTLDDQWIPFENRSLTGEIIDTFELTENGTFSFLNRIVSSISYEQGIGKSNQDSVFIDSTSVSNIPCKDIKYDQNATAIDYALSLDKSYFYGVIGRYYRDVNSEEVFEINTDTHENRLKLVEFINKDSTYLEMNPMDIESDTQIRIFKGKAQENDVIAIFKCEYGPGCQQSREFISVTKDDCSMLSSDILPNIGQIVANRIKQNDLDSIKTSLVEATMKFFDLQKAEEIPFQMRLSKEEPSIIVSVDSELITLDVWSGDFDLFKLYWEDQSFKIRK